ncbi:hypothetical protein CR513_42808, partial [Mucuna pruriens]
MLYQGPRSVEEYHKQMKIDLIRAQIKESEEATLAREGTYSFSMSQVMIVKDDGEVESEISIEEVSTSSEVECLSDDSHYEGNLLVVKRLMNSQRGEEVETQRENILHSRCLILGNLCSIDRGSCINVASERLMKKLALPIMVPPRLYRLQWLNKKQELLVDKQATVVFILGGYKDGVVCDVVPMEATHLLLGRPWQFDKKVL